MAVKIEDIKLRDDLTETEKTLLAALEEAEKQLTGKTEELAGAEQANKETKEYLDIKQRQVWQLADERDKAVQALAEAQTNYKCAQETLEFTAGALRIVTEQKGDLEKELAEAQQTIARQQDHMKLKDDAVEFWIGLAGRLADACEYYADEHWDNGTMAEDALSYYLPAVGRKRP